MMYRSIALVAALSTCLYSSVNGFSTGSVAFHRASIFSSTQSVAPSTCLFAAEEGETTEETAATETKDSETPAGDAASDILNSPAFLQRKLDVIKSDIAKMDEEIAAAKAQLEEGKAEWSDQFDALESEFQNIQNRFSRQGSKGDEEATINVARKLLEVIDNYNRAFQSVDADSDEEKAIESKYMATYDKILSIFADLGILEVETLGKEFDYEVHQAVMQRPSDEYEEGIVCEELQKGYKFGDRLIRAAMVSVAA